MISVFYWVEESFPTYSGCFLDRYLSYEFNLSMRTFTVKAICFFRWNSFSILLDIFHFFSN